MTLLLPKCQHCHLIHPWLLVANLEPTCIAAKTGHKMEKEVSTMFHYFSIDMPLLVPGSLVLDGWPGIPHGKLGLGAKPPSLKPVLELGIPTDSLRFAVNTMLHFKDGFTPPSLFNGNLRPWADSMGASLIMYYEESELEKEVGKVGLRMRTSMIDAGLAPHDPGAHTTLVKWGSFIKVPTALRCLACHRVS